MRSRLFALLSILVLASGLAIGACGGGDDTNGDSTVEPLTPRPRTTRTAAPTRTTTAGPSETPDETGTPGETETPDGTRTPRSTDTGTPEPTGTETATESPTPRPSRTPGDPGEQYNGSPIDGAAIETVFFDAGFEVSSPASGTAYPGMSRDGFPIGVSKDGNSGTVVIFVYESPADLAKDWKAEVGSAPEPQEGTEPPGYLAAWWNNNTVVLVTQSPGGELQDELLDAYLELP